MTVDISGDDLLAPLLTAEPGSRFIAQMRATPGEPTVDIARAEALIGLVGQLNNDLMVHVVLMDVGERIDTAGGVAAELGQHLAAAWRQTGHPAPADDDPAWPLLAAAAFNWLLDRRPPGEDDGG